jgi:NADPH:quinone reductase
MSADYCYLMLAVTLPRFGGPEVLEINDVPCPVPKDHEILVRVHAAALNRADLLQRMGRYPAPAGASPDIPGLEFAGEVVERGHQAVRWSVGERVFGIIGGGAQAEYLATHQDAVAAVPNTLSWDEAAAVPEAFITAHDALVTQANFRAGETVLVHAVGSGVGLAAIQLVDAFGGIPYGTARSADKIDRARTYGMRDGIAVGSDLSVVAQAVEQWTDTKGIDVILELVGGDYMSLDIRVAARQGRIILIGTIAGASATVPLGAILSKRITLRGTVLRSRPLEEKILATRGFERDVVPLLARGVIRPVIDSVYPLDQIQEAHARLESNETFGKVVVQVR